MKNFATFKVEDMFLIKITQYATDRKGYEEGNKDVVDYITETRICTKKWDEELRDFVDGVENTEKIKEQLERHYNLDFERVIE